MKTDLLANRFGETLEHSIVVIKDANDLCELRFYASEPLPGFTFELVMGTLKLGVSAIRLGWRATKAA